MKTRTKSLTAALARPDPGRRRGRRDDRRHLARRPDAADGVCSLREAILAANNDAARNECPAGYGADRILLDLTVPRVVELSADLPRVSESVAVRAASGTKVIVYGQELYRIFVIDSPATTSGS